LCWFDRAEFDYVVLLALRTDSNMEAGEYSIFHQHFERTNVLVHLGIVFFKSLEGRQSKILTEESAASERDRQEAASNRRVLDTVAEKLDKMYCMA